MSDYWLTVIWCFITSLSVGTYVTYKEDEDFKVWMLAIILGVSLVIGLNLLVSVTLTILILKFLFVKLLEGLWGGSAWILRKLDLTKSIEKFLDYSIIKRG